MPGPRWPARPSRLVHHPVAQHANLRRLDLDDVAGLEPHRRIAMHAGAGRRPGPDQVARLERRERADVVDQPGEAPGQALGRVLLAQLAVDAGRDAQRLAGIELVGGHDPGAEAARLVEILALGDVQRAVAEPVAHAALVPEREAADHFERALARDVAALLADHQYDLALVVELV